MVIYIELATQYLRTQRFALCNLVAFSYFVLHALLSAILFHLIISVRDLDLVGKFLFDEPNLKALAAGLEWQAFLRLRIFTFRTPQGKEIPIGVELFWEKIAKLFEKKLEEKEETAPSTPSSLNSIDRAVDEMKKAGGGIDKPKPQGNDGINTAGDQPVH